MARRKNRNGSSSPPAPQGETAGATARRLCFVLLCAAGLAALVSCRSSHRGSSPAETGARPLPTQDAPRRAEGAPTIRVAVLKDAPRVQITAGAAEARLVNQAGQEVQKLSANASVEILASPSGLLVGSAAISDRVLRIESVSAKDALRLNGQEVGPRLLVRLTGGAGLQAIALLDLEEYLCGVLAGEVPFERWHTEALKAQAVTSRSYAFHQLKRNANEPYDVESTVMSQVFKAGYRSNAILNAAASSTRGLVLTYNGVPFSAYFHSTCGGHTEPGPHVFPEQAPIKPLSGAPCAYCQQSPSFRWKLALDKAALEQKLAAASAAGVLGTPWPAGAKIQSLDFLDAAGAPLVPWTRAVQVSLRHGSGLVRMPGNQFRLVYSARELKSLLFERAVDTGAAVEISGGGFGHGVGLCQWGSQGMAQAGATYAQILGKYYPGAALTRMY